MKVCVVLIAALVSACHGLFMPGMSMPGMPGMGMPGIPGMTGAGGPGGIPGMPNMKSFMDMSVFKNRCRTGMLRPGNLKDASGQTQFFETDAAPFELVVSPATYSPGQKITVTLKVKSQYPGANIANFIVAVDAEDLMKVEPDSFTGGQGQFTEGEQCGQRVAVGNNGFRPVNTFSFTWTAPTQWHHGGIQFNAVVMKAGVSRFWKIFANVIRPSPTNTLPTQEQYNKIQMEAKMRQMQGMFSQFKQGMGTQGQGQGQSMQQRLQEMMKSVAQSQAAAGQQLRQGAQG